MALTGEETNYLRLAILVIKLSPQAVRILFDNRFPPVNLSCDLANLTKKGKLQNLFGKRILNQAQWDLLYPASGATLGSRTYDLTLLICLLRNIATPQVSKPVTGFDQLPPNHDISEGADMARIKFYRNLIAHHTDAELSFADFNVAWNNVTQAIGRLGGGRYNQDCIDLRVAALDGSDKEVYREVVKTQQALEQLKKELKEETVPWNALSRPYSVIKDVVAQLCDVLVESHMDFPKVLLLPIQGLPLRIHEIKIRSWEEKDKKYADTAVTNTVMEGIEKNQCVLITGNSGCGKSALAHHTALKLREKGYRILPVIRPGEISLYQNPNIQQVFVCDDICGKYYADNVSIEEWIRYEEDLKLIFENGDIKLLLTSRLIVSQDEHFKMMSFLSPFIISLNSPQHRFTVLEKKAMLKKYLSEDEDIEVSKESMESQDCFPLLCQLFGENESLRIDPDNFFSQPFEEYGKDLEKLKLNHPLKYCCLALLVMFEDEISEDILINIDTNSEKQDEIDAVCQVVGIPRGASRYKMKEELKSLENIYCRNLDGKIKSLHDKMFDFLSAKIGPTLGPCLLKYSSRSFIRERVRMVSALPSDDENVIILPQSLEQTYFDRMGKDIMAGNIKDVFFNKQMQQKSFEDAMVHHLSRMNDDELHNFIKKEGDYPQHSTKFLQRSKSMLDPFTFLGKMADDLDEVAKFHLSYTYSLLYQEKTCTLHWILAQGLYRVFLHVEERLPVFVKQTIMENYNLCISLSILEEKTEILEVIFRRYPHDTSEDDEKDKRYYPLFLFVCFTGNLELVKFLYGLGIGYLYPEKTESGESAVWLASFACQLEVLKFLVSKKLDVNSPNHMKATPLFIGAQRGHTNIVEYLLQNGANVNICKDNGTSPLFVASQEGHTEIVQLLLENHANVNICKAGKQANELRGASPLFIACKNGHVGIVQMLLSHEADVELSTERGKTPLLVALQNGHKDVVRHLIRKGADVNHQMDNGLSPFTVVSGLGKDDVIHALLDNGADIDIKIANTCQVDGPVSDANCNHGNIPSPLTMASLNNHLEVVKTLLQKGADIDYRGVEGATALFEAVQKGHLDMAKFLVSKKALVNISTLRNRTPLFVAVQRRFENIVTLLLMSNADVNLCRTDGVSPLLMATLHNNTKIVQILLQHNANPDLSTTEGLFPLIFAAKRGNLDILKLLIESGATVNCQNNLNQTPLWMAAYNGNIECIQFLLEKEANVNSFDIEGESVLLSAIRNKNLSLVQILINAGSNVNHCNHGGVNPLIRAAQCGSLQILECLLASEADINAKTKDGQSALMIAVDTSNKDIVSTILHSNADDVNDSDNKGHTVLWKAISKGDVDIVKVLLDNEANADISVAGKTTIDLANELGHTEITDLLRKNQGRLKQLFKTFGWITSVYSKINNKI